jgi:hypothetical protein
MDDVAGVFGLCLRKAVFLAFLFLSLRDSEATRWLDLGPRVIRS